MQTVFSCWQYYALSQDAFHIIKTVVDRNHIQSVWISQPDRHHTTTFYRCKNMKIYSVRRHLFIIIKLKMSPCKHSNPISIQRGNAVSGHTLLYNNATRYTQVFQTSKAAAQQEKRAAEKHAAGLGCILHKKMVLCTAEARLCILWSTNLAGNQKVITFAT